MVYLPPAFTETRPELLIEHIERHEFGLLVSHGTEGLIASQIPFLLARRDDQLYLEGHLARANPQLADLNSGGEALAIFPGPHAYISPSWYEPGPAVPTWNYATVHAYGTARTIADPDWLRGLLRRLTLRHEGREPTPPWRVEDLPETYSAIDAERHHRRRDQGHSARRQVQALARTARRRTGRGSSPRWTDARTPIRRRWRG